LSEQTKEGGPDPGVLPPLITAGWHLEFIQGFRDAVFMLDSSGRIVFVNNTALERSGHPKTWWIGRHFLNIVRPEDAEQAKAHVAALLGGTTPPAVELAYERADGTMQWVELSTVPLREKGRVIGVLGISRDLTVHRAAEAALEESHAKLELRVAERTRDLEEETARHRKTAESLAASEERYRSLFEHSIEGIAVAKDDVIIAVNRTMLDILGRSDESEVVGQPIMRFVAPESQSLIRSRIDARRRGEVPPVRFEVRTVSPDGDIRICEATATRVRLGGEAHTVATFRDVSGRKKAESRLKRLLDMQRRAVNMVSHEARNPLAAIKGYVELLRAETFGVCTAKQHETLQRIEENANRISSLVESFLEFDKIQARTHRENLRRFPLATLVHTVREAYAAPARDKGLELVVEAPRELTAFGDPEQLREVIDILVSNAVKYSTKGRIVVRATRRKERTVVDVIDQGVGISEDRIGRVFDRHQRDGASGDARGGMGMGLSMAKAIVEDHGGEIHVTSRPSKGTTFTVVLPRGNGS